MNRNSTEDLYNRAEELFTELSQAEIDGWINHPVTKSLQYTLYGDMAGHFESWANGEFTGENADETVQKNSKALGGVAAIEAILVWIEDAQKGELYD